MQVLLPPGLALLLKTPVCNFWTTLRFRLKFQLICRCANLMSKKSFIKNTTVVHFFVVIFSLGQIVYCCSWPKKNFWTVSPWLFHEYDLCKNLPVGNVQGESIYVLPVPESWGLPGAGRPCQPGWGQIARRRSSSSHRWEPGQYYNRPRWNVEPHR